MGDSLPLVDPRAAEIIRIVVAFEASVDAAGAELAARNWVRVEELLSAQHRYTHALANLLDETRDVRPPEFTDHFNRRITRIREKRDDQLERLIAFNHLVKERLVMISRARELRRVGASSSTPSRIVDTIQ